MKKPTNKQLIFGLHAVKAALQNQKRKIIKLYMIESVFRKMEAFIPPAVNIDIVDPSFIAKKVPDSSPHQGILLETCPLPSLTLEDIDLKTLKGPLILLDQVSDPHNLGAILRTAAVLKATAVLQPQHNTPEPTNMIVSKTASGALEHIPLIQVTNLARAMDYLKKNFVWCLGVDEHGVSIKEAAQKYDHVALIMGAEGKGLRPLTRKSCDALIAIPANPEFSTLNVSNAAAIAMYEFSHRSFH